MGVAAFSIAVSGLRSQQNALNVIANNISNSSTTGYKSTSMNFEEIMVADPGQFVNGLSNQYGNGVRSAGTTSDWTNGDLDATNVEANLAISGDGFLPVFYNNEIYYTRSGDFALVAEDPANPDTSVFYLQRPSGSILIGGTGVDDATQTVTGMDKSTYVTFQGKFKQLTDPVSGDPLWQKTDNTTVPPTVGTTTVKADADLDADGKAIAVRSTTERYNSCPTSFEIAADGTVVAYPTDEIDVINGYVGVQRFSNPDSLKRYDSGLYKPTVATAYSTGKNGLEAPSVAGQNGSGYLVQGSLEGSNVDLVVEFTDMIVVQRAFQGNAKTITTADSMLETVLGLIR